MAREYNDYIDSIRGTIKDNKEKIAALRPNKKDIVKDNITNEKESSVEIDRD